MKKKLLSFYTVIINSVQGNIFMLYAILLQGITGILLLLSPDSIQVARLGVFNYIFPTILGAILMISAAILAAIGLFYKKRVKKWYLFFFPSLFFLILSTVSALIYIVEGQYADGTVRPSIFILVDQLPALLSGGLYLLAINQFEKEKENE